MRGIPAPALILARRTPPHFPLCGAVQRIVLFCRPLIPKDHVPLRGRCCRRDRQRTAARHQVRSSRSADERLFISRTDCPPFSGNARRHSPTNRRHTPASVNAFWIRSGGVSQMANIQSISRGAVRLTLRFSARRWGQVPKSAFRTRPFLTVSFLCSSGNVLRDGLGTTDDTSSSNRRQLFVCPLGNCVRCPNAESPPFRSAHGDSQFHHRVRFVE